MVQTGVKPAAATFQNQPCRTLPFQARNPGSSSQAVEEIDWGEEIERDNNDLLTSLTQAEATYAAPKAKPSESDLLAMTLLLQEDNFEELLEANPPTSTSPGTDRLNRSLAVFAKDKILPCPASPTVEKSKEDLARAQRLQHKAQGEASWLRKEREKREREHNKEMKRYQDLLANLEQKLKEEKKKTDDIEKKGKGQIFFLNQEKEQMKSRLEKLEEECRARKEKVNSSTAPTQPAVKLEEKTESPAKTVATKVDVSSQLEPQPDKRRLVLKVERKTEVIVRAFTEISGASPECKCSLLLQTNQSDLQAALSENTNLLTESIREKLPVVVIEDLLTMESFMESFHHLLSAGDLGVVTECCSRVMQTIIRSQDCQTLQPLLSIIVLAWTPRLLSPDISGDIMTLVSQVVSQVVELQEDMPRAVVRQMFSVMSLVTADPDHCTVLCRQAADDCPLRQILPALTDLEEESRAAACESMMDWLHLSTSLDHRPGWTDNSCPGCTSETIKTLMTLLETEVYAVVTYKQSLDKVESSEGFFSQY